MISKDDILGRSKPKLVADQRQINPDLDPAYINYETTIGTGTASAAAEDLFTLGCSNLKHGVRFLKDKFPSFYKAFFPRVYQDAAEYPHWRWANFTMATHTACAVANRQYIESYDSQRNAAVFAALWKNSGCNQFFVTKELYGALSRTEPPKGIDLAGLKMPFDAIIFQLPSGTLQYKGEDAIYIGVAKVKGGKYGIECNRDDNNQVNLAVQVNIPDTDAKYIFVNALPKQSIHFATSIAAEGLSMALSGGPDILAYENAQALGVEGVTNRGPASVTPDVILVHQLMQISLNLLLALEARPELLERGRRITHNKREPEQELWQPNFVGRKYRVQVNDSSDIAKGSHSSPRTHWRAGHWRRQGTGKRLTKCTTCGHQKKVHDFRTSTQEVFNTDAAYCQLPHCNCMAYAPPAQKFTEYRTTWIEPCLVNAKA